MPDIVEPTSKSQKQSLADRARPFGISIGRWLVDRVPAKKTIVRSLRVLGLEVKRTTDSPAERKAPSDHFFNEVRPDDTYFIGFPRSGTAYLRHMVTSLILGRPPKPGEVARTVPDIYRQSDKSRPPLATVMAKSHAPVEDVPANVIYMIRDGRAALQAVYDFRGKIGKARPATMSEVLHWRDVWPTTWESHVRGWLDYLQSRDRSLVLRYEDLVSDAENQLAKVASFLGLSSSPSDIRMAVECSTRSRMRASERAAGTAALGYVGAEERNWRQAFPREDLCRFEEECGDLLARLGYPLICTPNAGAGAPV